MPAIRKALTLSGLTLDDIDLVELNEAFAAQVLACLRELPIDPEKLNVNGGAIALGHPLGCTGAKLTDDDAPRAAAAKRPLRYGDDVRRRRHGRGRHLRTDLTCQTTRAIMTTAPGNRLPRIARRGVWLLEETPPETVFTPERLTDEQRLIRSAPPTSSSPAR